MVRGFERIAVRYFFKRGKLMRYGIMARESEHESGYEHVFFQIFVVY
jgi:hypothetical protein